MNGTQLQNFLQTASYRFSLTSISVIDVVEIIIIAVVVYEIIKGLQLTRAWALFRGIFVLLVFAILAVVLQFNTIIWLMSNFFSVAIVAVVVIFQPEIRRALEQLGTNNFIQNFFSSSDASGSGTGAVTDKTVTEIVKASAEMGKARTGALIIMENKVGLGEYERTGIAVDSVISNQLLENIFEHDTPLHDGAVLIRGNRIVSATCYLPLSDNRDIGKELGTRHRAAVGISEVSDCIAIVISEETGAISGARDGKLYHDLTNDELKAHLLSLKPERRSGWDIVNRWRGYLRHGKGKKGKS